MKQLWYENSLCLNKRECFFLFIGIMMISGINLSIYYHSYKALKNNNIYQIEAVVENQYKKINKRGREYSVLKLGSDNIKLYITTYGDIKNLIKREISVKIITKNITFLGEKHSKMQNYLQKKSTSQSICGRQKYLKFTNLNLKKTYRDIDTQ